MDSDQNEKVCPLCAETIKTAAKVCPFCRASQTRFARWPQYLGPIFSGLTLLAVLVFGCIWLFPDVFRAEGRSFAPHREELVVGRISLERDQKKPEFWMTGCMTN